MIDSTTKLTDIYRMNGVSDLPSPVKAQFSKALRFEAKGDHEQAEKCLNAAVEKETQFRAQKA